MSRKVPRERLLGATTTVQNILLTVALFGRTGVQNCSGTSKHNFVTRFEHLVLINLLDRLTCTLRTSRQPFLGVSQVRGCTRTASLAVRGGHPFQLVLNTPQSSCLDTSWLAL